MVTKNEILIVLITCRIRIDWIGLLFYKTTTSTTKTIIVLFLLYFSGDAYPEYTDVPYLKTLARTLPLYTLSVWDKTTKATKEFDVQLRNST